MSKWYEKIPYGPLTREDHDQLSLVQYDDTDFKAHEAAIRRGVHRGDYVRLKLGEMIASGQLEKDEPIAPDSVEGVRV